VWFYCIYMLEVLQYKAGEASPSGSSIDRVRLCRIGGKDLLKGLAHINPLPAALQKSGKGICILRSVPVKTLYRWHYPRFLFF
jgi:hypothetical protein